MAAHTSNLPDGMEKGLDATEYYDPPNMTFPFGAYVCVVDIDRFTGETKVRRFYALDDCGTRINPMIIEGQIHGGLTEAFAVAFGQAIPFDENGNHLGNSLMDYFLPTAVETPHWETDHTVTPSPHHPIGAKGVAESPHVGGIPCFTQCGGRRVRAPGRDAHGHAAHGVPRVAAVQGARRQQAVAPRRDDRHEGRAREDVSDAGLGRGRLGIPAGHRGGGRVHARGEDHRAPRRRALQGNGDGARSARRRCRSAARSRCATSIPAAQSLRLLGKGTDSTGTSGASMDLTARIEAADGGSMQSGGQERSVDERQGGGLRRTHDEFGRRPDPEAVRRQFRGAGRRARGDSAPRHRRQRRAVGVPPASRRLHRPSPAN